MRLHKDEDRCTVTVYGAGVQPDWDTLADVARRAGGFTLADTSGGWIDPSGVFVAEESWTVTLFGLAETLQGAVALLAEWAIAHGESEVCATWAPCSVVHYTR